MKGYSQGNTCATAQVITPGTYLADGPSAGAGFDGLCWGAGTAINADWYVFTPMANGTITARSCGYGTDTRVSMFTGSCGTLTCIGQGDDDCETSPGGAFFASQIQSVPVTAGQNYYIQWDDRWTTQSFFWDLVFNCAGAPQATQVVNLDCANSQFFIDVTINAMGTAATANITNNAGAATITNVGLGTHTIGPFPLGTSVQYTLENNSQPGCDFYSVAITNFPCPIVSCGPDNYTYCYGDNENTYFVYQSASTFPIALVFNAGTMYTFGDAITIYDGFDSSAPVLFTGNNGGTLTGLLFVSTNPNNALTMHVQSDAFTSCAGGGGFVPWDFTVSCLDCTNPQATFVVVPDCIHRTYSIQMNLTSTGTATTANVTNTFNSATVTGLAVGTHTIGPFPMDQNVQLAVLNGDNPLCRIYSPNFNYNSNDCIIVGCGPDPYTYCYTNNDDAWWVYQSVGSNPLTISFDAGQMLTNDKVVIYNGLNDFAAVIYNGNQGGNLAGLAVSSSNAGNYLAMRVLSNSTGSCSDGAVTVPLQWTVGCGLVGLDETQPGAFRTYPNPTDGLLYLELSEEWSGAVSVQLMDPLGRMVQEHPYNVTGGAGRNTLTLDMGNLQNGNYLVRLVTEQWVRTEQVILVR